MKKMGKFLVAALVVFFITTSVHAVELKLATLAPQGTSLYNAFETLAKDMAAKTGGRITIKIFGGGVQGDEKDVVRKMRYGQIDVAALTGVGLGMIDPQVRVLELPFLFNSTAEVDKVYTGMEDYFKKAFQAKGFELLGWAEIGFVKIFTNKPIQKKADLKGIKMWMWEGDPLAKAMYDAMGVTPVPLAVTDVLTSLQTNLIDAVYSPEFSAIGMQWHTKTKFMTDVNLVNGTGGIIITNQAWQKIPAGDKVVFQQLVREKAKEIVAQTRRDNADAKVAVQGAGIKIVALDSTALTELQGIGKTVREQLTGSLYSADLLNKVLALLK